MLTPTHKSQITNRHNLPSFFNRKGLVMSPLMNLSTMACNLLCLSTYVSLTEDKFAQVQKAQNLSLLHTHAHTPCLFSCFQSSSYSLYYSLLIVPQQSLKVVSQICPLQSFRNLPPTQHTTDGEGLFPVPRIGIRQRSQGRDGRELSVQAQPLLCCCR